jgi:drug/metabolite transporter (DMT)-like permease
MNNLLTYAKLVAAVLAWGGTFIAAKYAVIDASIEVSALLRFSLASVVLLLILKLQLGKLPRLNVQQLFYVVLLGLTGVALYNLFFFFGLQTVEAGRGALIITSNPLWVALGSVWFFRQRFGLLNIVGLILCSLGVAIVLSRGHLSILFSQGVALGELSLLGCALSWAAYTLTGKKLMNSSTPLQPLALVSYSCVSGSLLLLLWIMLSGHPLRLHNSINLWASISYLSLLGTVAGFVWFFQGVQKIGAAQAAVFVFFVPVSAIIMGHLILNEALTLSLFMGAVLIIGGVAMVNRPAQTLKAKLKF